MSLTPTSSTACSIKGARLRIGLRFTLHGRSGSTCPPREGSRTRSAPTSGSKGKLDLVALQRHSEQFAHLGLLHLAKRGVGKLGYNPPAAWHLPGGEAIAHMKGKVVFARDPLAPVQHDGGTDLLTHVGVEHTNNGSLRDSRVRLDGTLDLCRGNRVAAA